MASTAIVPTSPGSVEHVASLKGFRLEGEDTNGPANGRFYGMEGGAMGFFAPPTSGTGEVFQIYEISEGFWTEGTPGISVTKNSDGNFTIDVPDGGHYIRIWKDILTAPGDLDGSGALILVINRDNSTAVGGPSTVNQDRASAIFPDFKLIDSSGQHRDPGDVAVTAVTTVASGATTSTITGLNGLGQPLQITIK